MRRVSIAPFIEYEAKQKIRHRLHPMSDEKNDLLTFVSNAYFMLKRSRWQLIVGWRR